MRKDWCVQHEYAGCAKPVHVRIYPRALSKICYLMQNVKTEWACDLLGTKSEDDNLVIFHIQDIHLFEQRATFSTVDRLGGVHPDAIGVLHSHHTMGCFFSHTDDQFANENHDLSGVISEVSNAEGLLLPYKVKFTCRIKGDCGKYVRRDNVYISIVPDHNVVEEIDLDNIQTYGVYGGIFDEGDFHPTF